MSHRGFWKVSTCNLQAQVLDTEGTLNNQQTIAGAISTWAIHLTRDTLALVYAWSAHWTCMSKWACALCKPYHITCFQLIRYLTVCQVRSELRTALILFKACVTHEVYESYCGDSWHHDMRDLQCFHLRTDICLNIVLTCEYNFITNLLHSKTTKAAGLSHRSSRLVCMQNVSIILTLMSFARTPCKVGASTHWYTDFPHVAHLIASPVMDISR